MQWPRFKLRHFMIRLAIASVVFVFILDVWRHSVIECPPQVNFPRLWIDYGKLHITVGGARGMACDYEFRILWWNSQPWSPRMPGHLRPIRELPYR